jgi:hypothetical protein
MFAFLGETRGRKAGGVRREQRKWQCWRSGSRQRKRSLAVACRFEKQSRASASPSSRLVTLAGSSSTRRARSRATPMKKATAARCGSACPTTAMGRAGVRIAQPAELGHEWCARSNSRASSCTRSTTFTPTHSARSCSLASSNARSRIGDTRAQTRRVRKRLVPYKLASCAFRLGVADLAGRDAEDDEERARWQSAKTGYASHATRALARRRMTREASCLMYCEGM